MLRKEYDFWMHGAGQLAGSGDVYEHVISMSNGSLMNRYYDRKAQPRPEAFREDVHLAEEAKGHSTEVYINLRAAAESGWDFSSRWLADGKSLATIKTTDIIPVDLNCLLFHLEVMIARGLEQQGKSRDASQMRDKADARRRAIITFCWNAEENFFFDYNFKTQKQTAIKSLAGAFPLFFELAQPDMISGMKEVIKKDFLQPGGLTTTLVNTGQQWDAPNGWAPLQWIVYQGLKNYNEMDLAAEIKRRWLKQNERVYKATGKMMEKYNVMDTTLVGGGGEYPNQDGFGWTNGVALAMIFDQVRITKE